VAVELAEIFRLHGQAYRAKHKDRMLLGHERAMRAIEQCRSAALGGHVYSCPECETKQYQYHSCRNRHCPKCQTERGQEWLEKQQEMLLAVPYYLLTFTLPEEIRRMARSHQKQIYDLLFRIAAKATQKLSRDARFVGGEIGLIGVLHTWGRNLNYHPHVHFLVPAGGWDGSQWRNARKKFLLPVRALSKIFRAKFRDGLQKTDLFESIPFTVWRRDWVVHCQEVGNGVGALKYLAPYIFRVAISNKRILKMVAGKVTFRYKASGSGKRKVCSLPVEEFMRRFLQHVLPKGFVKVRYYGFFSPGKRKQLGNIREYLKHPQMERPVSVAGNQDCDEESKKTPSEVNCPECGKAMQLCQVIRPKGRCPPEIEVFRMW